MLMVIGSIENNFKVKNKIVHILPEWSSSWDDIFCKLSMWISCAYQAWVQGCSSSPTFIGSIKRKISYNKYWPKGNCIMITNNPHNFLQYSHLVGNCLTNLSYSTLLDSIIGSFGNGWRLVPHGSRWTREQLQHCSTILL